MCKTQSYSAPFDATISIQSRCRLGRIICRRSVRFFDNASGELGFDEWSIEMNLSFATPLLHDSITPVFFILAEEFHDIAPPVDYSLIPPWLVFVAVFVALSVLGLIVWLIARRRKPAPPPRLPREIALEELERISGEMERVSPYQFSIRVSDILRRYVTQQYGVPATRQTSIEFLSTVAEATPFSEEETSLLEDFLNRCDLIKFAQYEATMSDSKLLLDEAIRFVKGAQLATV
jgi:hypothetical protein